MINKLINKVKNIFLDKISDGGFTLLIILYIIIVLSFIGFLGFISYHMGLAMWFVYQNFYSMALRDQFILIGLTIFLLKSFSPTVNCGENK